MRGYQQNVLNGDNGIFFSTELSHTLVGSRDRNLHLELIPFIDLGKVWNSKTNIGTNNTLAAIGTGLRFSLGDNLTARLDFGLPLTDLDVDGDTLQENGIYFSVESQL